MAAQKRSLDDSSVSHKSKKSKTTDAQKSSVPVAPEEVDFPRGGGTTFTPLEVKAIRAEAVQEANEELFEDAQTQEKQNNRRKRKSEPQSSNSEKTDRTRIEHLNYKRIHVGMKILGQIISIQPLELIISLPNQLLAHVPITNVSSQLTTLLENFDEHDDSESDEEDSPSKPLIPDLSEIFHSGQYVRAVVTAVHAHGSTAASGIGKSRDEYVRASRRVELSLVPGRVNAGVQKSDIQTGFTLTAAVKTIEDHGYILDLGLPDISGFMSFKATKRGPFSKTEQLQVGRLLDVTVSKLSSNGRICDVDPDSATFSSSYVSEVSSVTSVLPGTLVQSLITAVHPTGLNVQILGFFEGTVDEIHLRADASAKAYKIGKKIKARVLYDFSSTPPKFALALNEHIVGLNIRQIKGEEKSAPSQTLEEVYPIGTILEAVKILRIETERGVVVEIKPGVEGFIHISHISDDHVPSIASSGPWKANSIHRARVTGYFLFDGLLQLSFRPSVLEQKFLQVGDVEVGEVIKGTIKRLTDSGLFVSMSGNIDGVIWPNHYADITLKHPSKRFKAGANIKCRVLVVDPDRKRIALTAKKALLESTLPILSKFTDAQIGVQAHAVVYKVFDKHLMVEFYNNMKAMIPAKEVSETTISKLSDSFPVGKTVKVRIISVDQEQERIIASIRQATSSYKTVNLDTSGVEIGDVVEGVISDIHKDNVVLTLRPSQVRALVSLKNLANHRSLSEAQLLVVLKPGDVLEELLVVTRNAEKGFVIVANKPKVKASLPSKGSLAMDSIKIGQIVGGRVTRHTHHGTLVKIAAHIGGMLHPTDSSDNYENSTPFLPIDSIIKATVVGIDQAKKQLTLSTRHSLMYPDQLKPVVDREISSLGDLQVGESVRGFIKSVAEHGLFVTIGRDIDARVQIRELFDEYVKDWKSRFTAHQLVTGRILSVDVDTKKIEMSFRSGTSSKDSSHLNVSDLHQGQKVDGIVKKIEDYGLFIEIAGSKLSGLCHKSQLSDSKDSDVTVALHGFREGDRVKAFILSIEKRRISLSLKPSHFVEEDFEVSEDDQEVSTTRPLGIINDSDNDAHEHEATKDIEMESVESDDQGDDDDDEHMQVDVDENAHRYEPSATSKKKTDDTVSIPAPSLKLAGGFQWFGGNPEADEDGASSSGESDQEMQSSKKKKRKRKEIELDLTADMHKKTPESNADFERLLLGSPNSSYLWIQYMSFQLQLSEVEKAREIARTALKTINFREEQEKLNVWIALLNLENVYGTDEILEAVFKEAARANDSKTVHLRLALIFDQADKHEKSEEQYRRTCKKFGQSSKVWTLFGEHYLRRGNMEQSRKLLPQCLQSLDKRKHLKTISRFAQLEYKLGDPERGKTIFEGIVDSHPKRWDIWSIYMDMEAGQGDIQNLRNLFDRVLALKMTSHKAKSFFKKWLDLERRIGDEDGATTVKQKAVEWTQKANSS